MSSAEERNIDEVNQNGVVECKELFSADNTVVIEDLKILFHFAKEDLFQRVKFLFNESILSVGNQIYNVYIKECVPKLKGTSTLKGDLEKKMYVNFIWTTGTTSSRPAVQRGLSAKRTTVYNGMRNKFEGKFHSRNVAKVFR